MATVTQQEIDALESAIRAGTKTVTMADRSITYRDLKEMQSILATMKAEIATGSGSSSPFSVLQVSYSRGL